MNKKTYLIEKAEKGLTIQQYLKQIAGFSNAQIRSMKFTENGICLGGQRARVTTRLSEGDVLEVLLETKNSSSAHLLSFEQMPDILYEDADVIAVNKPAGMAVHPSHGHYQDTLANQLAYYFRKNTQQAEIHSIGWIWRQAASCCLPDTVRQRQDSPDKEKTAGCRKHIWRSAAAYLQKGTEH